MCSLLPNPWFNGELPTSKEQPRLRVKLRHFTKQSQAGYPYELPKVKPHRIPYYEILGRGPPPRDVAGGPGDIYVDTNPPCTVYIKRQNLTWRCWNRPGNKQLPTHPIFSDRYLWKTVQGNSSRSALSWFTGHSIRSAWGFSAKDSIDPSDMITELYTGVNDGPSAVLEQTASGRQYRVRKVVVSPSENTSQMKRDRTSSPCLDDTGSVSESLPRKRFRMTNSDATLVRSSSHAQSDSDSTEGDDDSTGSDDDSTGGEDSAGDEDDYGGDADSVQGVNDPGEDSDSSYEENLLVSSPSMQGQVNNGEYDERDSGRNTINVVGSGSYGAPDPRADTDYIITHTMDNEDGCSQRSPQVLDELSRKSLSGWWIVTCIEYPRRDSVLVQAFISEADNARLKAKHDISLLKKQMVMLSAKLAREKKARITAEARLLNVAEDLAKESSARLAADSDAKKVQTALADQLKTEQTARMAAETQSKELLSGLHEAEIKKRDAEKKLQEGDAARFISEHALADLKQKLRVMCA